MRKIAAASHFVCITDATRLCALVAAICRTNSNEFEFVQQIAATKLFRSDNDCDMLHEAICCSNLSRWRVVAICRIVCLGLIAAAVYLLRELVSMILNITVFQWTFSNDTDKSHLYDSSCPIKENLLFVRPTFLC